jgi:hypothetical protein
MTLAYLHLPIPHAFGSWNPKTQTFSNTGLFNYLDNLELADKTVMQRFRPGPL